MPKLSQYVAAIGPDLVTIFTAIENLEPAGATFLSSEITAAKTEFATVGTALSNFAAASTLGKISAGLGLLNVFGGLITFIEATYKNGEAVFASDWPAVKQAFDNLLALFKGTIANVATSASATPAPAAAPAPITISAATSLPAASAAAISGEA